MKNEAGMTKSDQSISPSVYLYSSMNKNKNQLSQQEATRFEGGKVILNNFRGYKVMSKKDEDDENLPIQSKHFL